MGNRYFRYSFGAVALFALTGLHPPPAASLQNLVWNERQELLSYLGKSVIIFSHFPRSRLLDQMGVSCLDLVSSLVCDSPSARLSFESGVRDHFFFAFVDWRAVAGGRGPSGLGQLRELDGVREQWF